MKILKTFSTLSIKASPKELTQDIGQISKISLQASSFCQELLPIKLKFSGSAQMGIDYILYYIDRDTKHILSYRVLTTNEYLVETFIFNSNNTLDLYLFPINYNSTTTKTVEVNILPEPRIFFTKVCCATILLHKSVSIVFGSASTNVLGVGSTITSGVGDQALSSSEFDIGQANTHIDFTYPVIEPITSPTVQFEEASVTYIEGNFGTISISRSGDLSQNSIVKLFVIRGSATQNSDFVLSSDFYVIFKPLETTKEVSITTILDNLIETPETLGLRLESYVNSTIGTNQEIAITIEDGL